MIGPEHERARPAAGPGFGDAVTFSWGDLERGLYGSARLGLAPDEGGDRVVSALALLFDRGEVAASFAAGGEPAPEGGDWSRLAVGDVQAGIEAPLRTWDVAFDGDGGGFELRFEALTAPLTFDAGTAAARAAGLTGYEQLCRVTGRVHARGRRREVACLGQRGHQWGAPDWEAIALARTLSAWLGTERAVALAAVRPAGAADHAHEAVSAWLVVPGEDGPEGGLVAEPRLSTLYDGDGRQRRAGLELWPSEDAPYPRRVAGEAVCGTSLALGRLRLDAAFFRWWMEGHEGVGRYDVLRRAA